ncbi:hypothetical protein [Pseudoalteromonas sp.]|uniref:hypothetical protein n=1 Tax=Pseudoalteromonas sp. TaxID=53249 RepID=UPI001BCB898C|nr:hypothetical protein [Pseudoalteromonas sp.]
MLPKDNEMIFIEKSTRWVLGFILISVSIAFYYYNNAFGWFSPAANRGDWGAMGDYFGGLVNPILSFATILLLLFSIKIQVKELKATTQELKETKEVHQESVIAQDRNLMFTPLTKRIDQIINDIQELNGQPIISMDNIESNIQFVEKHSNLFDLNKKGLKGFESMNHSFKAKYKEGLVKNLNELKRSLFKMNMILSELYRVRTPKIAFITDDLENLANFLIGLTSNLEAEFDASLKYNDIDVIAGLKKDVSKLDEYLYSERFQ